MDDYKKYDIYSYFCGLAFLVLLVFLFSLYISIGNEITSTFIELAKKENLQYAVDIYPFYSSDVSAALRGGQNIKGALIGPGVHASHGMERTHIQAVENTYRLVLAYIHQGENHE